MSAYLLAIFVLTAAFLVYFALGRARTPAGQAEGKAITALYLTGSTIAMVAMLLHHLAFTGQQAADAARHIEFQGVAVTVPVTGGAPAHVRLTGDLIDADAEVKRGFRWYALPSGAWIDIRPARMEGSRVVEYAADAHGSAPVLRINGMSINQPAGGWITSGNRGDYIFVRSAPGQKPEAIRFSIKVQDDSILVDGSTQEVRLTDRLSLRDVLRRSKSSGAATLDRIFAGESNALDRLQFVRQIRSKEGSAVGLVGIDPESPADQNIAGPDEQGQKVGVTGNVLVQTAAPATIGAGESGQFNLTSFSNRERHSLRLPSEIKETVEGSAQLRLMFDPPRAFPLPPAELLKKRNNRLTLASGDIGQTTDGYVFDTGNLMEAMVTNVQFSPDRRSWKIPRGVNEEGTLGTGAVSPIFALADPFASRPSWIWPVAAVLIGFFACMLSFVPGLSRKKLRLAQGLYQSHAAFVLWVVAATILSVRVVMALRASMLPPFNMDSLTARSYEETWPRAMIAMGLVVVLGIITPIVVWAKEAGWTPKWASRVADLSSSSLHKIAMRPWQTLAKWLHVAALALVAFQAAQRFIPALPDVSLSLYAVLLMILGLVLEGVGHARDEQFAEGEERTTLASKAQTAFENRPVLPIWLKIGAPVVGGILLLILGGWKALVLLAALVGIGMLLPKRIRILGLTAVLLLLADAGSFIFFVPFTIALCAGGIVQQLRSGSSRSGMVSQAVLVSLLVLTVAGISLSSRMGGSLLTGSPLGTLVSNSPVPYRLAATDAGYAENLLLEPTTANGIFSTTMLNRTLHQRWQMLSYVKSAPLGYFQAPITNVGMTYGTVLSDAAYSVLLVGEHGPLAGVLVVGLWLALAFALIRAAWSAACSRNQRANARGLYAIGAVLGAAAVYMALANVWQVPFVGQNLPFLALNSMRDLVFNGLLLIAALLLIAFPGSWSSQTDPAIQGQPLALRAQWWAFPALLTLGGIVLTVSLFGGRSDDKSPFNYRTATLDAIEQKLKVAAREYREGTPLAQTFPVKNGSRFLREISTRFDEGDISGTPVVAGRSREDLSLDRRSFRLNSPLAQEDGVPWHGSLTAAGAVRRHQLFVGGSRVPVILEQNAGPAWITMGRRFPAMRAQSISLRGPRGREEDYGGIKLDGGKILLKWNTHLKEGRILVNGEVPAGRLNEVQLQENDTVSLEYEGEEGVSQRLSLTYPGPSEANLGRVLWRNGRYARSYPQGRDFPLAYSIAMVADENQRKAKEQIGDVKLSLDLQLQRDLQERLRNWARGKNRLVDKGRQRPDGIPFTAVAVLDSHSGQVRTLASLPQVDPNEDINLLVRDFPNERQAYTAARSSWTLENRTIGSSVKPITFAALSAQLRPNFDLTKLRVNEASAVVSLQTDSGTVRSYRQLGDILLNRGRLVSSRENPRAEVDMAEYLRDSRTWPAVVTGTIGLVADSSPNHVKEQKREIAALLGGSNARVGFRRGDFRPKSALDRLMSSRGTLSSVELADTALFKGLEDAYGPSVVPFNIADQNRFEDGMSSAFLKPLKLAPDSNLKSFVLPEPHWADTTLLTDLDKGLLRYMIGGGECKWNALTMAANAARLTTGKKVQPTLSTAKQDAAKEMPAPINQLAWREAHLFQPLSSISTLGSDRAALSAMAAQAGYRLIMKTGTIDDGMGKQALESEMIMFTVGRYVNGSGFVPGQSLSGFLSVRSSKRAENREAVKADLMREVLPLLIRYLKKPVK